MKQQAERFLEKQNNCFQITKIYYCNKIMSQVTLTLRLFITTLIFMTKYRENYIDWTFWQACSGPDCSNQSA